MKELTLNLLNFVIDPKVQVFTMSCHISHLVPGINVLLVIIAPLCQYWTILPLLHSLLDQDP